MVVEYFLPREMVISDNLEEIHICSVQTYTGVPQGSVPSADFYYALTSLKKKKKHWYATHPLLYCLGDSYISSSPETEPQRGRAAVCPRRCVFREFYHAMQEMFWTTDYHSLYILPGLVGFSYTKSWDFSQFSSTARSLSRLDYCNWIPTDQTSASDPSLVFSRHPIAAFIPHLVTSNSSRETFDMWQQSQTWSVPYLLEDVHQASYSMIPSSHKQHDHPSIKIQERYALRLVSSWQPGGMNFPRLYLKTEDPPSL